MRYHNFDLWIGARPEGGYALRAVAETSGEAHGVALLDPYRGDLADIQDRLAAGNIDKDFLTDCGEFLYASLFVGDIAALFEQCCTEALKKDEGIRLRLRISPPEIATVPWEFLYSPFTEGFLGTSVWTPVVRYLEVPTLLRELETASPCRMLIVIPNVLGLDTEAEKEHVVSVLTALERYVQYEVLEGNVTRTRLRHALTERQFHLLHFIGHGKFQDDCGFLRLNTGDGKEDWLDHVEFAELLRNSPMKLVVLNSCQGAEVSSSQPLVGTAPALVRQGIPAVVAMRYEIPDDVALHFAQAFYHSLFKGWASGWVEVAISHARHALASQFANERALGTPILFLQVPEGVLFDLVTDNMWHEIWQIFSRRWRQKLQAVERTHIRNIAILEDSQQPSWHPDTQEALHKEKAELARLKQRLRFRNASLVTALSISGLIFLLLCLRVLDILPPDVKIESYTVWLGDMFVEKSFNEQIVLVTINKHTEQSLRKSFDRTWRHEHAMLVETLSLAGAKVIAFDMYFKEPTPYDTALAEAIQRARTRGTAVVVGIADIKGHEPEVVQELRGAVQGWGVLCVGKQWSSAQVVPLVTVKSPRDEGQPVYHVPSFALQALAAYQEGEILPVDREGKKVELWNAKRGQKHDIGFSEMDEVRWFQPACPAIKKGDAVANVVLDLSPLETLRRPPLHYAYHEIMQAAAPTTLEQFRGKIVVVGVEKEGHDVFHIFRALHWEERSGVELHADAINTVWKSVHGQVPIRPLGQGWQLLMLLCLSLLGAGIRYGMSHALWVWRMGLMLLVLFLYLAGTISLYSQYRVLFNTLYHVGALWAAYWVVGKVEQRWFR